MNPEEEFDDIFRRKTEKAKFSFNEADWDKARKMIDKERIASFNSTSRVNYWHISAFVLVSSIAILYLSLPEYTDVSQADEVVFQPEEITKPGFNSLLSQVIPQSKVVPEVQKKLPIAAHLTKSTGAESMKVTTKTSHIFNSNAIETKSILPPESQEPKRALVNQKEEQYLASTAQELETNHEESVVTNDDMTNLKLSGIESRILQNSSDFDLSLSPIFLKRYEDDYVKKAKPKSTRSYFDATFGLSYSAGWQNNGVVTARALNGFAGLNYGHFLSKKLSFSLGVELYNLSHMNQVFYTGTSKDYGFGAVQTQTTLACQSMLFLSVPLRVYYSVDQNHLLGLGIHAGTLLMSNNTYETSEIQDGSKQNTKTLVTKGVYEGMNTRNLILSASLDKIITKKIALKFEMYYGISDLFSNTSANSQLQSSNGIRIGMNYRITRN